MARSSLKKVSASATECSRVVTVNTKRHKRMGKRSFRVEVSTKQLSTFIIQDVSKRPIKEQMSPTITSNEGGGAGGMRDWCPPVDLSNVSSVCTAMRV